MITIKNVDTGEILSKGLTTGTTRNTKSVMKMPLRHGDVLSDDQSAKFTAIIDIKTPTFIEVTATGPMAIRKHSFQHSMDYSGKNIIIGDALTLELSEFVLDILSPPAHIEFGGSPALKFKSLYINNL